MLNIAMKRGLWLVVAMLLIPSVAAVNSIGDTLFGTNFSDEFLLRALYFAIVFVVFYALTQKQVFKEPKEKKFAIIFSLALSLVIMRFTPVGMLNAVKGLLILFGPFVIFYTVGKFFIKSANEETFSWGRMIFALVMTGLLFLVLASSPGLSYSLGGVPLIGLGLDELFAGVYYGLFSGLSPLIFMVLVGVAIFGIVSLFSSIWGGKGKDGKREFGKADFFKGLGVVLLVILGFALVSGGIGGLGGGFIGILTAIRGGLFAVLRWVLWIAIVILALYGLYKAWDKGWFGKAWKGMWQKGKNADMYITFDPGAENFEVDRDYTFKVIAKRGALRGKVASSQIRITASVGEMTGNSGVRGKVIQERIINGRAGFIYHAPDAAADLSFNVVATAPDGNPFAATFDSYTINGGTGLPKWKFSVSPNSHGMKVGEELDVVVSFKEDNGRNARGILKVIGGDIGLDGKSIDGDLTGKFKPTAPGNYVITIGCNPDYKAYGKPADISLAVKVENALPSFGLKFYDLSANEFEPKQEVDLKWNVIGDNSGMENYTIGIFQKDKWIDQKTIIDKFQRGIKYQLPDGEYDNCSFGIFALDSSGKGITSATSTIFNIKKGIIPPGPGPGPTPLSVEFDQEIKGEFKPGDKPELKWTVTGDDSQIDKFVLYFSIDGGRSFVGGVDIEKNKRKFTWTIPDVESDNCYMVLYAMEGDNGLAKTENGGPFRVVKGVIPPGPGPKPVPGPIKIISKKSNRAKEYLQELYHDTPIQFSKKVIYSPRRFFQYSTALKKNLETIKKQVDSTEIPQVSPAVYGRFEKAYSGALSYYSEFMNIKTIQKNAIKREFKKYGKDDPEQALIAKINQTEAALSRAPTDKDKNVIKNKLVNLEDELKQMRRDFGIISTDIKQKIFKFYGHYMVCEHYALEFSQYLNDNTHNISKPSFKGYFDLSKKRK